MQHCYKQSFSFIFCVFNDQLLPLLGLHAVTSSNYENECFISIFEHSFDTLSFAISKVMPRD